MRRPEAGPRITNRFWWSGALLVFGTPARQFGSLESGYLSRLGRREALGVTRQMSKLQRNASRFGGQNLTRLRHVLGFKNSKRPQPGDRQGLRVWMLCGT